MSIIRSIVSMFAVFSFSFCASIADVYADTHTAKSCSYADVSAAIISASPEDTVLVPSGTCTWSNTLIITKGINLIGAGIGKTIINNTTMRYEPSDYSTDYAFRLSGFTFNGAGCTAPILYLGDGKSKPTAIGNNKQTKIRIDHNKFYNTCTTSTGPLIWLHQGMFGSIDNNEMYSYKYALRATHNGSEGVWRYWGYYPGMEPVNKFGHGDNIYIEDNEIHLIGSVGIVQSSQDGTRWVYRYNNIYLPNGQWFSLFDQHGNKGSSMLSVQGTGIYGNNLIAATKDSYGRFLSHRGGQAMVFNNNLSSTRSNVLSIQVREEYADSNNPPPYNLITGQPQHVWKSYYWNNRNNFDGAIGKAFINTTCTTCIKNGLAENIDFWQDARRDGGSFDGSKGCGCGPLDSRPSTCTEGVGYWATEQSCTDLTGMVGANPSTPISGSLYICNNSNQWVKYYTPLTYPHPLRQHLMPPITKAVYIEN
jgi:hypothetical protein